MSLWGMAATRSGRCPEAAPAAYDAPVFEQLVGRVRQRPPLLRAVLLRRLGALALRLLVRARVGRRRYRQPTGRRAGDGRAWLGNLPALLGFGFLLAGALSRVKRHIPLLSAACVFALGILTLNSRVNVPAFAVSAIAGSNTTSPASLGAHARRLPLPPKAWPMTSPAREQAAPVDCLHCGQPVPSRGSAQAGALFCCAGCQSVYEIVQASGLSVTTTTKSAAPSRPSGSSGVREIPRARRPRLPSPALPR